MLKKVIIYILGFLLTISLLLTLLVSLLLNTALDKQYILDKMEQTGYYQQVYGYIKEDFSNYIMQAGLEENDLNGIYDQEKVKKDVNNIIDSVYENKSVYVSTSDMIIKLDTRINQILQSSNRIPSAEEQEAIKNFENTIAEVYTNNIWFAKNYVDEAKKIMLKIKEIAHTAIVALIILISLITSIIFILSKKVKEIIQYMGTTVLATGLLALLPKLLIGNITENAYLLSKAFSNTVIEIVNSILSILFATGVAFTVVGILSVVLGAILTKEKRMNYE